MLDSEGSIQVEQEVNESGHSQTARERLTRRIGSSHTHTNWSSAYPSHSAVVTARSDWMRICTMTWLYKVNGRFTW